MIVVEKRMLRSTGGATIKDRVINSYTRVSDVNNDRRDTRKLVEVVGVCFVNVETVNVVKNTCVEGKRGKERSEKR